MPTLTTDRAILAAAHDLALEVGMVVLDGALVDADGIVWSPLDFATAVSARLADYNPEQERAADGKFGSGGGGGGKTSEASARSAAAKDGSKQYASALKTAGRSDRAAGQLKAASATRVGAGMKEHFDPALMQQPAKDFGLGIRDHYDAGPVGGLGGGSVSGASFGNATLEQVGQIRDLASRTEGSYKDYDTVAHAIDDREMESGHTLSLDEALRVAEGVIGDKLDAYAGLAAHFTDGWADTSGDHDPQAMALQEAAGRVFGGTPYYDKASVRDRTAKVTAQQGAIMEAYVRSSYAATQQYFKEQGITHLALYRGVGGTPKSLTAGPAVPIASNPLSSWTTDRKTAENFARGNVWDTKTGAVLKIEAPVAYIAGTPITGPGCAHETEVVLRGTNQQEAQVLSTWSLAKSTGSYYHSSKTPVQTTTVQGAAAETIHVDDDVTNADWPKQFDDTATGRRERIRAEAGPPATTAPVDPESFLAAIAGHQVGTTIGRLTKLRGSLGTRLLAESEHAYDAALRQAGVRVKTRARTRLSTGRQATVNAAVDAHEPLKAWLGAVGITELELLRGSFDTLHDRAAQGFARYATRVGTIVTKAGLDSSRYVSASSSEQAVEYLVAGWNAMARRRLLIGDEALLAASAPRLHRGFDPGSTPDPADLRALGASIVRNAIRINEGAATMTLGATPDELPAVIDTGGPSLEALVASALGIVVPPRPGAGARLAAPLRLGAKALREAEAAAEKARQRALAAQPARDAEYIAQQEEYLATRTLSTEQLSSRETPEVLAERRARRERIQAMTPKQRDNLLKQVETMKADRTEQDKLEAFQPEADAVWEWVHGFYGEPTTVFEPHYALDGVQVTGPDADVDDRLLNDEGWPDTDFFYPDDHDGCTCDWILTV